MPVRNDAQALDGAILTFMRGEAAQRIGAGQIILRNLFCAVFLYHQRMAD